MCKSVSCAILPESAGLRTFSFESCTSALDEMWSLIEENSAAHGDSVICHVQTRGRGQMGRQWFSPSGNLYAAWYIPSVESILKKELLPLVIGLSLKRALAEFGFQLSIKWPNDLIYNETKIGGILIEDKQGAQVAGIGLNLCSCPKPAQMREFSIVPAGSLGLDRNTVDVNVFWSELVKYLYSSYIYILCNFSLIDFIREINLNMWLIGEKVRVDSSNGVNYGVFSGIGQCGEILLINEHGEQGIEHKVSSGTISRLIQD